MSECSQPNGTINVAGFERRAAEIATMRAVGRLAQLPALMVEIARFDLPDRGAKHWCALDACFQNTLAALGRWPCTQHALVGDLNSKPTYGCCG